MDKPLSGIGVLVTRPVNQAAPIATAIEKAGGTAVLFPVMDIIGRPAGDILYDASELPAADIAIFVSRNAVRYGIDAVGEATRIAAIGPATKKAIETAGLSVAIRPDRGYDSEHLLAAPELKDVSGLNVRILRGNGGRELLADTLRERGARVDYLEVYRREPHAFTESELDDLSARWDAGAIQCAIAMSVESFEYLLAALPYGCRQTLSGISLVTPSERVIQTALDAAPEMKTVLAAGPGTTEMLAAMAEGRPQGSDDTQ